MTVTIYFTWAFVL